MACMLSCLQNRPRRALMRFSLFCSYHYRHGGSQWRSAIWV